MDTFNISNTLLKQLLLKFGILQFLTDLGSNRVGHLLLLPLPLICLVPHPRIQHSLGLRRKVHPLLQLKHLRLHLGSILRHVEQVFRDVNDIPHFPNGINAFLNRLFMLFAGGCQDLGLLCGNGIDPFRVAWAGQFDDEVEEKRGAEEDDGFIVEDVELFGDGGGESCGADSQEAGFADDGTAGEGIDEGCCSGLGVGGWGSSVWGGDLGRLVVELERALRLKAGGEN